MVAMNGRRWRNIMSLMLEVYTYITYVYLYLKCVLLL